MKAMLRKNSLNVRQLCTYCRPALLVPVSRNISNVGCMQSHDGIRPRHVVGGTPHVYLVPKSPPLHSLGISSRNFSITRKTAAVSSRGTVGPAAIDVLSNPDEVRNWVKNVGTENVALVPTMGALHQGHLSLIRRAALEYSQIILSIYVNPTQFGVNEDLSSYPKTLESDVQKLSALNEELETAASPLKGRVAAVFVPSTSVMYPNLPPTSEVNGHGSFVTITPIANPLEGASRPVFFRGVATICMKLFNIVRPACVVFGQKDAQQLSVICRMVQDFFLPIRVLPVPTEREADGLAMSSRNVFLGTRRRRVGQVLSKALLVAHSQYSRFGKRSREDILGPSLHLLDAELKAQKALAPEERALFEVEYLSMANHANMEEIDNIGDAQSVVISGAIRMLPVEEPVKGEFLGEADGGSRTIRLIDNIFILPK